MGEHARHTNDVAVARNAFDQLFEGKALNETFLALRPRSNGLYGGADTIDDMDLMAESTGIGGEVGDAQRRLRDRGVAVHGHHCRRLDERQLHWPGKVLPCPLPAGQP